MAILHANFFEGFAKRTFLERFEEVYLAADDAPATRLGRANAERQEHAAMVVYQQDGLRRLSGS
jgi:hypothetical protein